MADFLTTMSKLPEICASRLLSDRSPILIKRGISGYWPAPAGLDVEAYNARHGITQAQHDAMQAGSMFGWDCSAADPDCN